VDSSSSPSSSSASDTEVVHRLADEMEPEESSLPHTTTHTWHETVAGPETVSTEVDEHGNVVRRTVVKTEQVKHTVQTQSYQTFAVDENTDPSVQSMQIPVSQSSQSADSASASNGQRGASPLALHTHTVAYENGVMRE